MRKVVFISAVLSSLLLSCGGGSGGGLSGGSQIPLYLTDDASIYPSILVNLYEINLCSDNQCLQKVNLFSNQQGLEVDLAQLNGVLQYIGNANVPQGTYTRLELILDKNLKITDPSGNEHDAIFTPMDSKPNKPNVVQCPTNDKCHIRFNGTVNPFADGRLVVDFELKEFEVNTSTNPWQVTEVKVKPLTKDEMRGISYINEIYLIVQSVSNNTIIGQWMGRTYTVNIGQNTLCEINHMYTTNCTGQIQPGMCIEVKAQVDPAVSTTLNAIKIENHMGGKCMGSSGSYQPPIGSQQPPVVGYLKLKGIVTQKGSDTFTINTYNDPIKITSTTYCEYQEHVYLTGNACLTGLQTGWLVEVKINSNGEAIKIEREY